MTGWATPASMSADLGEGSVVTLAVNDFRVWPTKR